jgi:hypothetical protein
MSKMDFSQLCIDSLPPKVNNPSGDTIRTRPFPNLNSEMALLIREVIKGNRINTKLAVYYFVEMFDPLVQRSTITL